MTNEERKRDVDGLNFGAVSEVARTCHGIAQDHGFWKVEKSSGILTREVGLRLMLIVTEVAEAMEWIRKHDDACIQYEFAEELADIVIRVFDLAAAYQVDIGGELRLKMLKNVGRETLHGKTC